MPKLDKWTLVQHSGYGFAGKPTFRHAVEEASISSAAELATVERAGGLIFDSYAEASDRAETENYPTPDQMGILPHARGTFAKSMLNGLHIYIPPRTANVDDLQDMLAVQRQQTETPRA